jgi:hypothetical protein
MQMTRVNTVPDASIGASLRRMWLTIVIAVVLSAIEIDPSWRPKQPTPIVMISGGPRPPRRRVRPYRAHYRFLVADR